MKLRYVCALLPITLWLAGYLAIAAEEPRPQLVARIRELDAARQLILVISDSWEPGPARLQRFERANGDWRAVGEEIPVTIGKNGLAWGIGLHGTHPPGATPKREGDGKAPAGVFELDEIFGSISKEEAGVSKFPYRQVTPQWAGVDDPNSRHYNRIVDSRAVEKDWNSAEEMVRADGIYRIGAVVRHNWRQWPGAGSCIFIHEWMGEKIGTSGCTAMAAGDLEVLLRWLDAAAKPLLVQLPNAEYQQRKGAWGLP